MRSSNSEENLPGGSLGGSSLTTCFSCSNGVPHMLYGNLNVASSSNEMPRLHTSDLISYCEGLPEGSIRSGCMKETSVITVLFLLYSIMLQLHFNN
jgi:hypothetical protein